LGAKVCIIGVGMQGEASLLPSAREILRRADLILGDPRHLREIGGVEEGRKRSLPQIAKLPSLLKELGPEKRVVILASGDPNLFGVAEFLYRHIPPEDLEVLPNVSSMQWAFARLKMGWSDAYLMTVHGRDLEEVVKVTRTRDKIGLFTDPSHTPSAIARRLVEAGVSDLEAHICCDLGGPKEQIVQADLHALQGMNLPPRNFMILYRRDPKRTSSPPEEDGIWEFAAPGIPDDRFASRGGMITKEEVRCLVLSKARIRGDSLLWDVGAGCGSISIEAARIAREGRVYGIERDKEQLDLLRENQGRFGIKNLEVIHGEAPEALLGLPAPDRVVVGGSGGRLSEILTLCLSRLRKRGRIVVIAVSLSTLAQAWEILRGSALSLEDLSIQIARGEGEAAILRAHNPIHLLIGQKHGG